MLHELVENFMECYVVRRLIEAEKRLAEIEGTGRDGLRWMLSAVKHENEILRQERDELRMECERLRQADSILVAYRLLMSSLEDRDALKQTQWPNLPIDSSDWGKRTWSTILDVWLRLIRQESRDIDIVLRRIAELRAHQNQYEGTYLDSADDPKGAALELIGLYHLAKAAEILALGVVDGNTQVQQIRKHFDSALAVCEYARLIYLEPMASLLKDVVLQTLETQEEC